MQDGIPAIPSDDGHAALFQTIQEKFLSSPVIFARRPAGFRPRIQQGGQTFRRFQFGTDMIHRGCR